jgi:hypothetical protein
MSALQQMPLVERYFAPYFGKLHSQEDVYMAVFYPKAIGNPDYRFPAKVLAGNPGIFTPRDYAAKANRRAKLASLVGFEIAQVADVAERGAQIVTTQATDAGRKNRILIGFIGVVGITVIVATAFSRTRAKPRN